MNRPDLKTKAQVFCKAVKPTLTGNPQGMKMAQVLSQEPNYQFIKTSPLIFRSGLSVNGCETLWPSNTILAKRMWHGGLLLQRKHMKLPAIPGLLMKRIVPCMLITIPVFMRSTLRGIIFSETIEL